MNEDLSIQNANHRKAIVMKTIQYSFVVVTISALAVVQPTQALAQSESEIIQAAREVIEADRQAVVSEVLQLTDAEGEAFWPLYHKYRTEMDKVGDGVKALVLEYARLYPEIPDDQAKKMLRKLGDLEKKQAATRASYLKKFAKVLPAPKALKFAQVENRLDLAVRLQLAANIPLVPTEGKLAVTGRKDTAIVHGAPGGVMVDTYELTAQVVAIDRANRKVTLVDRNGTKETVKAGSEVMNFDQIRVGDMLKVRATQELVVRMGEPEASDASASVIALAPKGAKPGGMMADTVRMTATISAIDRKNRTATLKFQDGTTKIYEVRPDIDLSKHKAGEKVTIRVAESLAISMGKP